MLTPLRVSLVLHAPWPIQPAPFPGPQRIFPSSRKRLPPPPTLLKSYVRCITQPSTHTSTPPLRQPPTAKTRHDPQSRAHSPLPSTVCQPPVARRSSLRSSGPLGVGAGAGVCMHVCMRTRITRTGAQRNATQPQRRMPASRVSKRPHVCAASQTTDRLSGQRFAGVVGGRVCRGAVGSMPTRLSMHGR